jgi:hypothetical protein
MRVSFVCVCTVGLTVLVWRGAWTAILSCASHTRRCQQHVQGRALPLTLEAQLLASTHGCWAGALRALQGRGVLCRPPTALQRMRPHRQLLAVAAGGLHVSVCMRSYCVPSRWPSAVIRFLGRLHCVADTRKWACLFSVAVIQCRLGAASSLRLLCADVLCMVAAHVKASPRQWIEFTVGLDKLTQLVRA